MEANTKYKITYTDGRLMPSVCKTLTEAMDEIKAQFPRAVFWNEGGFMLDGDETDFQGQRILTWETLKDSENDDGAHSCASITHTGA